MVKKNLTKSIKGLQNQARRFAKNPEKLRKVNLKIQTLKNSQIKK